jgi:hypothetical protein
LLQETKPSSTRCEGYLLVKSSGRVIVAANPIIRFRQWDGFFREYAYLQ